MAEARTFTQTKAPKKRFFARVAGSRFCHDDGTETYFYHGFADIEILEHQQEIERILGKNPNIYIPSQLPEKLPDVPQNALAEAELREKENALRNVKGVTAQEAGAVPLNAGSPSDPNASSVDQELQAAVFRNAPKVVGPGAATIKPVAAIPAAPVSAAATSVSTK